jgi:hypothetical protein
MKKREKEAFVVVVVKNNHKYDTLKITNSPSPPITSVVCFC